MPGSTLGHRNGIVPTRSLQVTVQNPSHPQSLTTSCQDTHATSHITSWAVACLFCIVGLGSVGAAIGSLVVASRLGGVTKMPYKIFEESGGIYLNNSGVSYAPYRTGGPGPLKAIDLVLAGHDVVPYSANCPANSVMQVYLYGFLDPSVVNPQAFSGPLPYNLVAQPAFQQIQSVMARLYRAEAAMGVDIIPFRGWSGTQEWTDKGYMGPQLVWTVNAVKVSEAQSLSYYSLVKYSESDFHNEYQKLDDACAAVDQLTGSIMKPGYSICGYYKWLFAVHGLAVAQLSGLMTIQDPSPSGSSFTFGSATQVSLKNALTLGSLWYSQAIWSNNWVETFQPATVKALYELHGVVAA